MPRRAGRVPLSAGHLPRLTGFTRVSPCNPAIAGNANSSDCPDPDRCKASLLAVVFWRSPFPGSAGRLLGLLRLLHLQQRRGSLGRTATKTLFAHGVQMQQPVRTHRSAASVLGSGQSLHSRKPTLKSQLYHYLQEMLRNRYILARRNRVRASASSLIARYRFAKYLPGKHRPSQGARGRGIIRSELVITLRKNCYGPGKIR